MKICKTDMFEFPKSCVSGRAWQQKHNCYIDNPLVFLSKDYYWLHCSFYC